MFESRIVIDIGIYKWIKRYIGIEKFMIVNFKGLGNLWLFFLIIFIISIYIVFVIICVGYIMYSIVIYMFECICI